MTEDKIINLGSPEGGYGRNGWSPADIAAVMGNNRNNNNGGIFGGNGMWDGVLGLFGLGIVRSLFGWNGNNQGNGRGGNDGVRRA